MEFISEFEEMFYPESLQLDIYLLPCIKMMVWQILPSESDKIMPCPICFSISVNFQIHSFFFFFFFFFLFSFGFYDVKINSFILS